MAADHDNHKFAVADRIHNAPVACADAVKDFRSGQLLDAERTGILFKGFQFAHDAAVHVAR